MASNITAAPDHRPTFQEAAAQLLTRGRTAASGARLWILILLAVTVVGVVGVIGRIASGFDDRAAWGYYAAVVSFLLSTAAGAPMVSIAPTLARASWVRPVTRVSQLFAAVGVVTALLFIPLVFALPPLVEDGVRRRSIWFGAPSLTPHIWGTVAILGLVLIGLALLWASSIPDLRAVAETATGLRRSMARRLAMGFIGTDTQWKALRMRIGVLGAFYFLFLIFTHIVFSADFAIALVAGWKDAIFPMYHGMTALQSGLASTIVAAFFIRKFGRLERYLELDQFWAMSKLLFATSLLWFYFFFSAFIVFWYGRSGSDQAVIDILVGGPYRWAFIATFMLSFVIPMFSLMWNPVRHSFLGPTIIGSLILFGMLLDRIRIYAAAWSAKGINDKILREVPPTHWPDIFDILVIVGAIGAAALAFLLATRLVPAVSLWEVQYMRLLTRPARFIKGHALIIGKPD
jgi:Ni/Fe-hydrogenase subunit HybB-like protein